MIHKKLLLEYGAKEKVFLKNETIFYETNYAQNYYQIIRGQVKICNDFSNGKEFIQQIFTDDECFGEALLFLDKPYPYTAKAITTTKVLELCKEEFIQLITVDSCSAESVVKKLAEKLYYKAVMAPEISCNDAERRIIAFLEFDKKHHTGAMPYSHPINYTRQQLADFTGLRVETVIRTLKSLEKQGVIRIENSKVYI
ncbi:Crp/Fnr family transcriptional regulator [Myroides injenensis]|uniref:Crp/Fnr family transcriptional regulator n=1 Tax=Myroides injenensis TaxID=1183151 RepID=UPI0002890ABA|nr:Crp/Fnr family transcriptional regulator [Myroides injenensis]